VEYFDKFAHNNPLVYSAIYTEKMQIRPEDIRPHFMIVGGGIAGLSLAYALSQYSVRITLLEAGTIGKQGASSVPVALLNPNRGRTARAKPEDTQGLAAMWRLVSELNTQGFEAGVYPGRVLRIADSDKQARQWQQLEGVRWLSSSQIPADYHAPYGGILVVTGGWLRPPILLDALRKAAEARGVRVIEQCSVTEINPTRVISTRGDFRADAIIICTGAGETFGLTGLPKLEYLAGDVIGLASAVALPYPLAGAIYGSQTGRAVFVGGNHRAPHEADDSAATRLKKAAAWFVPDLQTAKLTSHWSGVRVKQPGNRPLVTQCVPGVWFFGALAGRGFLCAYQEAQMLARQLIQQQARV
jgi:sarcosine oxidase subunit beta